MTGKRSSAIARAKPTDSQKSGVAALVASGAAPISGYVSTAVKPRPVRSSQTAAIRARARPAPRASAVVAMQVMTAGSGASGSDG